MEGIPEEDLRQHEKRVAGKDKDQSESVNATKVTAPVAMPPIPPLGMITTPPVMPMTFTSMPYGITPMSLPMMSMPMITQLPPSIPIVSTTAGNSTISPSNPVIPANSTIAKPIFPSGAIDVNFIHRNETKLNCRYHSKFRPITMLIHLRTLQ